MNSCSNSGAVRGDSNTEVVREAPRKKTTKAALAAADPPFTPARQSNQLYVASTDNGPLAGGNWNLTAITNPTITTAAGDTEGFSTPET